MSRFTRLAGFCVAMCLVTLPVHADLLEPTGAVVLEITGGDDVPKAGDATLFDLEMLESLPQHTVVTKTPWYEDVMTFSGPRLETLLQSVDGEGETLRVHALNDYSAEIPVEEIRKFPVILATRRNGERLSVREKGPLFVIYPFSDAPELYNEMTFNKSVWQVVRIEVE